MCLNWAEPLSPDSPMDHFPRASSSSVSSTRVVDVLVPVALDRNYSYRVPRGMELAPGDVVCVPLGPREVVAVVWAENANPDPRLHNRLKDVSDKLDVPPLKAELRALVDWVANYTLSARGMVLRMCLRMGENLGPERVRTGVRLVGKPPQRMTPARRRLIELLSDGLLRGKSDAAREAGVSVGVIDGLVDEGTLVVEAMPRALAPPAPDPSFAMPEFSRQQRPAVDAMRALAANGSFHVALLDGVTGSGKTEVYFEAIAQTIRRGRQSLILMPEIALTGQFLDRFARRFGVRPLEWHSELSPRTRQRNWAAISAGEAPVVVGARSALFMPYADLGLIVVDEEHDQAYKQEDGAHYHARDMAVVRAHIAKIPVVLASATPSVESEVNARKGRYQRILLTSRFGGQHMPLIEAIDLRHVLAAEPRRQHHALVAAFAGVHLRLDGWRGGSEHDRNLGDMRAHHRHVAGVIVRAFVLLVGLVVFLIDHDQPEIGVRQKQRRARADHDRGFAGRNRGPVALPGAWRQFGMPLQRPHPEA